MRQGLITCSRPICDALVMFAVSLMFYCCRNLTDVCLLKQGGSRHPPTPTRPGRILENNIARYVVRNQAETAEDAESTGAHHRIQQQAIFRFFPHLVVFDGFI